MTLMCAILLRSSQLKIDEIAQSAAQTNYLELMSMCRKTDRSSFIHTLCVMQIL